MDPEAVDYRVFVIAPIGGDASAIAQVLEAEGMRTVVFPDLVSCCPEIERGIGALLLSEEALDVMGMPELAVALSRQPPWSELPVVALTRGGEVRRSDLLRTLGLARGGITILERPLRAFVLASAVQVALRARSRQYQVRDLLQQRDAAQRALLDADRRKDEFLATLAHELRNPLAPMRNAVQIMRLAGADAVRLEPAVGMMERQLKQLVRLVDDLLDIARISRGALHLQRERTDLNRVVAGAMEISRPLIDAKGHSVLVRQPDEPVPVDADPTRLTQIASNLLNNAARYTPAGGTIRVSVERERSEAVLTIEDNGVGIPAESLGRVFDMFTRGDTTAPMSDGGLGVGLALVRALTELHGGRVEAASDGEGRGASFTVHLPVLSGSPAADERSERRPREISSRRVLIADDNVDAGSSLSVLLELQGHQARIARDGDQAVRIAEEFRPDLILMDLGMPNVDGFEATRRIRRFDWGRTMRIVALTGWGQEGDREHSRAAGCDGHLVKPVEPADLTQLLSELGSRQPSITAVT